MKEQHELAEAKNSRLKGKASKLTRNATNTNGPTKIQEVPRYSVKHSDDTNHCVPQTEGRHSCRHPPAVNEGDQGEAQLCKLV
jgi:hypothetical protein